MTQPDQTFPALAANFASLAAWAGKTQQDWEDEIHADTAFHFLDAEDGSAAILALLADVPIIGDIIEVLTGIEDGDVNDLGTWVANILALLGSPTGIGTGGFDLGAAAQNFMEQILQPFA